MPTIPRFDTPEVKPVAPVFTPQTATGASPEAFGEGVAKAQEGVGKALEQDAQLWAARAQEFQQQDNEAEANQLTSDYLIKQSEITEKFKQLQGRDPLAAMSTYTNDLKTLREDFRGKAGNAEVARLFDRESQRQFGYAVMNGSSYAATQHRQYVSSAEQALIDNQVAQVGSASNPKMVDEMHAGIRRAVEGSVESKGQAPEVVEQRVKQKFSTAVVPFVQDLAEKDPIKAREFLRARKDQVDGATYQRLENTIDVQTNRVVSREIVGRALPPDGQVEPGMRADVEKQVRAKAEEAAKRLGLDDAKKDDLVKSSVDLVDTTYNKQMATRRDDQLSSKNSLMTAVIGGPDGHGAITSMDDIVGPGAPKPLQDAYYKADPGVRKTIEDLVKRNATNDLSPTTPTAETLANRNRLQQLLMDDPEKFRGVDLTKEKLTRSDLTWAAGAQTKLAMKQTSADERAASKRNVDQAVGLMRARGMLDITGLRKEDVTADPAKMDQLRGALSRELDAFNVANKGRPPNEEELLKMSKNIVTEQVQHPYWFNPFGSDKTVKAFQPEKAAKPIVAYDDIPDGEREKIVDAIRRAGPNSGYTADRFSIRKIYQSKLDSVARKVGP